ncbi:MAG: OB-fold nucleic acid binding domain-containing protein [Candidatus Woesearchaeota archaeon]|nr:OB-fold nucleic acid binding domain-containing protein [Candidatus Woesearchaeota archaeon]MDP7458513.1 OB-fold nucleic acid binding domain-containing protein [Candidatus Woesearchaeota archaeon]
MQIKDLQANQGKCDITADVIDKGDIREFQKFGKPGRVCSAKIKDESGQSSLTLWNEQIEQVEAGDKVKITNGWCSEFQGELQLSTGKFGNMEIEKGAGSAPSDSAAPAEAPAPEAAAPEPKPEDSVDVTEEKVE